MRWLEERKGYSQRRACRLIGQPRTTSRYKPVSRDRDRDLRRRILELAHKNPRYGYRMVTRLLRREGWRVNRKRVHRIWRREGLQVPVVRRKKRRLGHGENGVARRRPEHVGHVWGLDFVHDETEDGRQLRWLSILEEFSRFNLALEVRRSFRSEEVIAVLEQVVREQGFPQHIRCDNGSEFIAEVLKTWLRERGVEALYIEPGSPWENGYTESFNGTLRNELLDREVFASLLEAKLLGVEYRDTYNHERPHSSLDDMTPAEFMAQHRRGGSDRTRSAGEPKDDAQNRRLTNATESGRHLGTPEITVGLS